MFRHIPRNGLYPVQKSAALQVAACGRISGRGQGRVFKASADDWGQMDSYVVFVSVPPDIGPQEKSVTGGASQEA